MIEWAKMILNFWTYLSKKVPGELLLQNTLFSNEIEKIFTGLGPLHHNDEGVVSFKIVNELHYARNVF